MARIDEIKEFIGFLKLLFASFLAIDVSLIGWLTSNYDDSSSVKMFLALILIVLFSTSLPLLVKKIIKEIKSLKDL